MAKARKAWRFVGAALLLGGSAIPAWAAPTPAQILNFHPRQQGVECSTPTAQEEATCKVELAKGIGKGSGWVLRDGQGNLMRRFFDTDGDNRIDVWSYFKDGVEIYREIDTDRKDGKADEYRWLNAGGSRWGVDVNGDGRIDSWKAIAAEEVSQEVLAAVATRDAARLQALLISEDEIKSLGLPTADANRIRDLRKTVGTKLEAAAAKAAFTDKTRWLHLETGLPQCLPADQTGMPRDYVKYTTTTVLCETAGKNEWLQTGEMIQVGATWRLIDAPSVGLSESTTVDGGIAIRDKELQGLLEQLKDLDGKQPKATDLASKDPEMVRFNLQRADILEKIVAKVEAKERDPWIRQVADCLSAAAQASPHTEKTGLTRLQTLQEQLVRALPPGNNLCAYVAFREMTADYSMKLAEPKVEFNKVQEYWLERMAKFVQTYPRSDDTPDVLLQLGMVSEFTGKEPDAKKWYQQVTQSFPEKPAAAKAAGAVRRLDLEGKSIKLAAPLLNNPNEPFSIDQLAGKIVVVYYWASWNGQTVGDFAKLKLLMDAYATKGLDVVTVNLDNTAEEAKAFLAKVQATGTHLFQPGGLDSPLAAEYGVMGLPNVFVIGKDGKVVSRTVQIANLEDELKKHIK